MSAEELAKLAQNPVGNLISVPFQNNTNLNFGPVKGTQNVLNIQPVIPIEISKDWNIITRTILPVISMPALSPDVGSTNGIGDTVLTAFLSPANPGHWIWGAGPVVQIPTNSTAELGNKNWGLGPSVVVLHLDHGDPWVYGVLVNNIWSLTSDKQGGSYNDGLIQPFVNYNFEGGLYLTSSPILTVDWKANSGQQWTVPIGGGVGKIFHLGKLPVNTPIRRTTTWSSLTSAPTGRSARRCSSCFRNEPARGISSPGKSNEIARCVVRSNREFRGTPDLGAVVLLGSAEGRTGGLAGGRAERGQDHSSPTAGAGNGERCAVATL